MDYCKTCNNQIKKENQICNLLIKTFNNELYLICNKEKPEKIYKKIFDLKNNEIKNCKKVNKLNLPYLRNCVFYNKNSIIYQYIDGLTLNDIIDYRGNINKIYNFFNKLLLCLYNLELKKVNHFDISPRNIIISNNQVFLIDYTTISYENELNQLPNFIGSYGYVPIEYMKNKEIIFNKFDIYSYGIILFNLLFCFRLFDTSKSYFDKCWKFCKKENCNRDICLQEYVKRELNILFKKQNINSQSKIFKFLYYSLIYSLKENPEERFSATQLYNFLN